MIIGLDRLRYHFVAGNTPTVGFSVIAGAPTVNASFPITNIYDSTSYADYVESTRVGCRTRIDYVTDDEFSIDIDLTTSEAIRFGLLSGFCEQSVARDGGGSSLIEIALEHSDDDVSYSTFKTINPVAITLADEILPEQLAFLAAADSHRYWRFYFRATSTGYIEIGYAGVYSEWLDVPISEPSFDTLDPSIVTRSLTGSSFVVERNEYDAHQITVPPNNDNVNANLIRNVLRTDKKFDSVIAAAIIANGLPRDAFSPRTNPVFAVAYDAMDDGSERGFQRLSERAQMVLFRREYNFSFDSKPKIDPGVSFVLDEWQ